MSRPKMTAMAIRAGKTDSITSVSRTDVKAIRAMLPTSMADCRRNCGSEATTVSSIWATSAAMRLDSSPTRRLTWKVIDRWIRRV